VPVGTSPVDQLPPALKSLEEAFVNHVAFCACSEAGTKEDRTRSAANFEENLTKTVFRTTLPLYQVDGFAEGAWEQAVSLELVSWS
jgi:hypothetical protein